MYGLIVSTSIIICALLAEQLAKKEGKNTEVLWGGVIWLVAGGIVGARLYHVLDFFDYYSANKAQILQIWKGGLGIYGGIFGGIIGGGIYLKYKGENILDWFTLAALVAPLGQAIGRWGNLLNLEHYPYFIYESLFNFALFSVMYILYKKGFKRFLIPIYFIGYGSIRFTLEFTRANSWEIHGWNVAQIISLLLIGSGVAILTSNKAKNRTRT